MSPASPVAWWERQMNVRDVDFKPFVQCLKHPQLQRRDVSPEHLGMWQADQKPSEDMGRC